ncbi:MAG: diguanylate cyclase/phosphodiesterase (GGDEF & EAL domains) with PAS/PAC sensor(s) [uncultured Sphingosinicella sp.]|uniref:Diguanylate cyclase/phosphodiesterase (GGDEF & EAL domains) with PAS/PAC sensor(S) n=1 Tax=uncultured Sphingosinicella sp. TaxID=478748 RepID=A0A6J4U7V4_9SPHN|nr:class I SAM-dependent methyltransferase [uncultured Sphingosinicella sp.]CAA9542250.1 MAG: diguanylate cyclase/phosphodiesterase (GGDEF & EAL domains) with PAS/PAC sensor(s) [uncultured Sphingosinicella sp.]
MRAAFIDSFSDVAGEYRRARPTYPAALIAELAALAPSRALAWDSGTGSGQAAVALARHFDAVYGSDPSEEQIANAQSAERVTYAVEAAEAVSLADGNADLVLAAQAMHWYNLERFYAQVQRVLRPGGILAAIGYAWFYIDPEVDAAVEEALLRPMRPYWAPNNAILWDAYRSIAFPGEEVRIGQPAIHLRWSLDQMLAYVRTWSAAAKFRASEGEAQFEAALASVREAWGEPGRERSVVMPMQVRVSRLA